MVLEAGSIILTDKAPIDVYRDLPEMAIEKVKPLIERYSKLKTNGIEDKEAFNAVYAARQDLKKKRIAAKAAVKDWQGGLRKKYEDLRDTANAQANAALDLVIAEEARLQAEEDLVTNEKARLKAIEEAAAVAKVQDRIDTLFANGAVFTGTAYEAYGVILPPALMKVCTDDQFAVFLGQIAEAKAVAEEKEKAEAAAKLAEEERLAKVAAEQEAERAELQRQKFEYEAQIAEAKQAQAEKDAEIKALQIAAETKLADERAALEAEKAKLAEAQAKEEARIKAEAKALADRKKSEEKAKRDEEARIKAEAEAKAAAEKAAAEKAAQAPDKEKLIVFMGLFKSLLPAFPNLATTAACEVLDNFANSVTVALDGFSREIETL